MCSGIFAVYAGLPALVALHFQFRTSGMFSTVMSKGVVDGALFLVAADVDVVVVGAAVGQPVDQSRIAMEGEDDRLVFGKELVDVDGITRKSALKWMTLARTGFAAATIVGLTATVRFMFPNVLFEPPTRFKARDPSSYSPGVDERWKEKYGIWIVRNTDSIYALVATCTHLGCTPNWLPAQNKFKCPCHGSGYYVSGVNFEGPTPRPLERAEITLSPDDGQIIVEKAFRFLYERGQWSDPKAFIKMA